MTLVLMGSVTFLIGVLPDFNTAGYWAPALLVHLRLMQGLSAGAETAGASGPDHGRSTRKPPRGFFASFALSGISFGIVLASLAFLPVAAMSEAVRLSWGWRIPVLALRPGARRRVPGPPFLDAPRPESYYDYYCVMSLAGHLAWILEDDGSEPPISFSKD